MAHSPYTKTESITLVEVIDLVRQKMEKRKYVPSEDTISKEDWEEGIILFSKILLKEVSDDSTRHKKRKTKAPQDKLRKLMKEEVFLFWNNCCLECPFSALDKSSISRVNAAMENVLHGSMYSMMTLLMVEEYIDFMDECMLDSTFGRVFDVATIGAKSRIALSLCNMCGREDPKHRMRAGIYLLWVIKLVGRCYYIIPGEKEFTDTTVSRVLSRFVTDSSDTVCRSKEFIEVMCFMDSTYCRPIYVSMLTTEAINVFLGFVAFNLKMIPLVEWKSKTTVITNLLGMSFIKNTDISNELSESKDDWTAQVGRCINLISTSACMTDAIPHIYEFKRLMPERMNPYVPEHAFLYPFPNLREYDWIYKDSDFVRRLPFNGSRHVFISGTIVAGVYYTSSSYGDRNIPSHLIAFDMLTEKMVWAVDLSDPLQRHCKKRGDMNKCDFFMSCGVSKSDSKRYRLKGVSETTILLYIMKEPTVYFIDIKTGKINTTAVISEPLTNKYDFLSFSPDLGIYYKVENERSELLTVGYKRRQEGEKEVLNYDTRSVELKFMGRMKNLGTHVGKVGNFEGERAVVTNPTLNLFEIKNCMDITYTRGKIYSLERDTANEHVYFLIVRSTDLGVTVLSPIEKRIKIMSLSDVHFIGITDDGSKCIIEVHNSFAVVEMETGNVTYGTTVIESYAVVVVDQNTGALWMWDELSRKVQKFSGDSLSPVTMGTLNGGGGTSLLYVDKEEHLYCVYIPF